MSFLAVSLALTRLLGTAWMLSGALGRSEMDGMAGEAAEGEVLEIVTTDGVGRLSVSPVRAACQDAAEPTTSA